MDTKLPDTLPATTTSSADPSLDRRLLLGAAGLAGIAALAAGRAQAGPLTPPAGAVASTGRTLSEVEPRTPIPAGGAVTITQPGSYYLTGDISVTSGNAIFILTDNVTLDLNGFSVNGGGSASNGVACYFSGQSRRNVTIRNGIVRSCAGNGIYCLDAGGGGGFQVEDVTVTACPGGAIALFGDGSSIHRCASIENGDGLRITGAGGSIQQCIVKGYSTAGITVGNQSIVRACTTLGAAANSTAIAAGNNCRIADCDASGSAVGIQAGSAASISGCSASGATAVTVGIGSDVQASSASGYTTKGFQLANTCTVRGCSAVGTSTAIGFATGSGCTLADCSANGNATGYSINAGSTLSRCTATGNTVGFDSPGVGSTVVDCTAQGNSSDGFVISANSTVRGCTASWNIGSGFKTGGSNARFEANNASNNSLRGFEVGTAGNFLSRNTASDNGTNWLVFAGNTCLVVAASLTPAIINGNSGGVALGSTDPNANFTF